MSAASHFQGQFPGGAANIQHSPINLARVQKRQYLGLRPADLPRRHAVVHFVEGCFCQMLRINGHRTGSKNRGTGATVTTPRSFCGKSSRVANARGVWTDLLQVRPREASMIELDDRKALSRD